MDVGLAKVLRDEPGLVKLTRTGLTLARQSHEPGAGVRQCRSTAQRPVYARRARVRNVHAAFPVEGKSPQEIALARSTGAATAPGPAAELPATLENLI